LYYIHKNLFYKIYKDFICYEDEEEEKEEKEERDNIKKQYILLANEDLRTNGLTAKSKHIIRV
jgi:hypothetical protein